jgi:hypothetical protein
MNKTNPKYEFQKFRLFVTFVTYKDQYINRNLCPGGVVYLPTYREHMGREIESGQGFVW